MTGEAVCAFVVLKQARPTGDEAREDREGAARLGRQGDRPDREAEGHPLRRQPAEDALGQDHAAAAALDREGRGDHAGRLDARESGDPRPAEADALTSADARGDARAGLNDVQDRRCSGCGSSSSCIAIALMALLGQGVRVRARSGCPGRIATATSSTRSLADRSRSPFTQARPAASRRTFDRRPPRAARRVLLLLVVAVRLARCSRSPTPASARADRGRVPAAADADGSAHRAAGTAARSPRWCAAVRRARRRARRTTERMLALDPDDPRALACDRLSRSRRTDRKREALALLRPCRRRSRRTTPRCTSIAASCCRSSTITTRRSPRFERALALNPRSRPRALRLGAVADLARRLRRGRRAARAQHQAAADEPVRLVPARARPVRPRQDRQDAGDHRPPRDVRAQGRARSSRARPGSRAAAALTAAVRRSRATHEPRTNGDRQRDRHPCCCADKAVYTPPQFRRHRSRTASRQRGADKSDVRIRAFGSSRRSPSFIRRSLPCS